VADPERFRQPLEARHAEHPELFPKRCAEGFGVQDKRCSITPPLWTRRSALTATAARCQSRPSCVLPSMAARTAAVAKALALRHWGVPFDALAYVCGRAPMCWYRAELVWGRPSSGGSTIKALAPLPQHVRADEKPPRALGQAVSVPTTVGGACLLGVTVTDAASADALEAASRDGAQAACALAPTSRPTTGCTDGWEGTQSAWRRLCPTGCRLLCFLHSVLTLATRCVRDRDTRPLVRNRVWDAAAACPRAQCSQRQRRRREGAPAPLPEGVGRGLVRTRGGKGPPVAGASRFPGAPRPSNARARLRHHHDRRRDARRYLHGPPAAARLAVRAMALEWNSHPDGARWRRDDAARRSPCHDLNGCESHRHWLHNLLIASSMGGRKL